MRFVLPVMNVQLKPMDGAFAAARQQERDGPLDRSAFATTARERNGRKDSDRPVWHGRKDGVEPNDEGIHSVFAFRRLS